MTQLALIRRHFVIRAAPGWLASAGSPPTYLTSRHPHPFRPRLVEGSPVAAWITTASPSHSAGPGYPLPSRELYKPSTSPVTTPTLCYLSLICVRLYYLHWKKYCHTNLWHLWKVSFVYPYLPRRYLLMGGILS